MIWDAKNAQGVAAQHATRHGHSTWVDIAMTVYYGPEHQSTTSTVEKN